MKFADEDRTTRLRREESYGMSFIRWWSVKKKKIVWVSEEKWRLYIIISAQKTFLVYLLAKGIEK